MSSVTRTSRAGRDEEQDRRGEDKKSRPEERVCDPEDLQGLAEDGCRRADLPGRVTRGDPKGGHVLCALRADSGIRVDEVFVGCPQAVGADRADHTAVPFADVLAGVLGRIPGERR